MPNKLRCLSVLLVVSLLASSGAGCTRAAKKNRYLDRANRYFQAGDYEKAELEYLNVLRLDPKNAVAVPRLGLICAEQGRLTAAYTILRRAEEVRPDDLDVRLKLGQTYFNLNGLKEAREEADFILQKQPTNAEALLLLVESSTAAKEMDDAQDRLQKLLPQFEKSSGVQLALGFLHLRRPDLRGAEAEIKQAIALDPKSSAAYQVLGTYYLLRNDSKQAEQAFKTASDLAPLRSPRRLRYADFKLQSGDMATASQLLEDITAKAPDYLPAWTRLADIAFKGKKYDDCDKYIKRILAKDPLHYETRMLSGRVRMAKGEGPRAVAEFERMKAIYPRSPQVKYQLGLAYLLNKDAAKAAASLNEAVALDPANAEAVVLLAQINLRKGDTASAIDSLTQLTKKRPQLTPAFLLLADAYRVDGNFEGALGVYRHLLELNPKDPESPMLMGLVLLQQNKKADARKAFEQALELAPDYLAALEQLVDLLVADKQLDAAMQRVQQQIEKYPKAPEPLLFAAKIYEARGDANQVEAALLKAIELKPDFRPAYLSLARIYAASNKLQQALDKLQGALAGNSNDITALMQIGMIHTELKNYPAAAASYEKLLAVKPQYSPALNNLAYLYSERLGRPDDAYKLARQAREVQPNEPFAADTLGWILYKRGEYAWALTLLQESAEKLPANPEVQFHLGMAHYMMDEAGPARLAFQRALQINKDFAGKDEIERRLKVLAVDLKTADRKTVSDLEQRLAEQPDDPAALARLAAIEERDGVFDKARDLYERTIKLNPKNVSATVKLAQIYAERFTNTVKALEFAKIARTLAPEDAATARALGRVAYRAGDFKWSLSLLEEGVRGASKDPEVLYDLAWSQYSLGRIAEAEATMQSAQKTGAAFARSDEASRFLATSPLCNDPAKARQAAAQVQDILKADPGYVPALMAAATDYEQLGNLDAAKTAYDKALARFPFFSPANKRLAALYAERLGDYQKAYEPALKAREALPDDPDVAKTLGLVVYRRGDYKRAVPLLRESAERRTTDAELYYYLGMAHYQLKEKSESKRALNQAMALNANAKFVEEAKKVLAELK